MHNTFIYSGKKKDKKFKPINLLHPRIAKFFVVLLLVAILPVVVFITLQQTKTEEHASNPCSSITGVIRPENGFDYPTNVFTLSAQVTCNAVSPVLHIVQVKLDCSVLESPSFSISGDYSYLPSTLLKKSIVIPDWVFQQYHGLLHIQCTGWGKASNGIERKITQPQNVGTITCSNRNCLNE